MLWWISSSTRTRAPSTRTSHEDVVPWAYSFVSVWGAACAKVSSFGLSRSEAERASAGLDALVQTSCASRIRPRGRHAGSRAGWRARRLTRQRPRLSTREGRKPARNRPGRRPPRGSRARRKGWTDGSPGSRRRRAAASLPGCGRGIHSDRLALLFGQGVGHVPGCTGRGAATTKVPPGPSAATVPPASPPAALRHAGGSARGLCTVTGTLPPHAFRAHKTPVQSFELSRDLSLRYLHHPSRALPRKLGSRRSDGA